MYLPAFGGWNIQVRALEDSNFIKQIREKKKKKYIYIYELQRGARHPNGTTSPQGRKI